MARIPKQPQKIKERLQSHERALRKEVKIHGAIDDSAGRRYELGVLYLLLGDVKGAVKSYKWMEQLTPDDMGDPFDHLCWTLALYRSGDLEAASTKLCQTMLINLYLIPSLIGVEQEPFNIWHGTNLAEKSYVGYAPPEIFTLWDEAAIDWARQTYQSPKFRAVRDRYVLLSEQLQSERPGPKRSQIVQEMYQLKAG